MKATALLGPLFLDFVHETFAQILMVVDIFLRTNLLYSLLLFELWPRCPVHSLATILESYVLFSLGSSLIHEFLSLVLDLFAQFVFSLTL